MALRLALLLVLAALNGARCAHTARLAPLSARGVARARAPGFTRMRVWPRRGEAECAGPAHCARWSAAQHITASAAAAAGGSGDKEQHDAAAAARAAEQKAALAAAADSQRRTHLRAFVLTLLVFQNAASAILTRWTRVKVEGVPMYFDSSAVLCTELLKVPMCAAMMLYTLGARGAWRDTREGFSKPLDVLKLAVPAMCYTLQNILFYVSLTNLSASTYQVLSQLKTLATAGFWVTMLGGRLAARQWGALGTLIAGVSVVQLDSVGSSSPLHVGNQLVGVSAVLGSSVLSGFANVYFEKLVKTTPTSIWVRNLQLAAFTVPQSLLFMAKDSAGIGRSGVLHGFTLAVWGVIALKALGGLVVASTVKFADSLLKSFATAISIIVTCLIAIPLYGTVPSAQFAQGVVLVIASVFMYNVKPNKKPAPKPEAEPPQQPDGPGAAPASS